YVSNKDSQHSYIAAAKERDYQVLLLDSPIVSNLIQKLEMDNENVSFVRFDADHIDKLIKKDDEPTAKLSEEEISSLKESIEKSINNTNYTFQTEAMDSKAAQFLLTLPEIMRRMKEMRTTGGAGMFGNFPEMYHVV